MRILCFIFWRNVIKLGLSENSSAFYLNLNFLNLSSFDNISVFLAVPQNFGYLLDLDEIFCTFYYVLFIFSCRF